MEDHKHIVHYSGGAGSWYAAKLAADKVGGENLTLLFTDTLIEDKSLYSFLYQGAAAIGAEVTRISDGRNPWQVFRDERFVGNSKHDPCSKILKRRLAKRWCKKNVDGIATMYFGIDFTEAHRVKAMVKNWSPHNVVMPMIDAMKDKNDALKELAKLGVPIPRLYDPCFGQFSHNNCGGFCVKAGQGNFKKLLDHFPERYQWHEAQQEQTIAHINEDKDTDKTYGFIKMQRNNVKQYLTMKQFREYVESYPANAQIDMFDIGACGCYVDESGDETDSFDLVS